MEKIKHALPVIISMVFGIIGWILLPDVVDVQIGIDGQVSNTMPKVFAILLPIAISVVGSIRCLKENQSKSKGVIISWIGPCLMIITLLVNL